MASLESDRRMVSTLAHTPARTIIYMFLLTGISFKNLIVS